MDWGQRSILLARLSASGQQKLDLEPKFVRSGCWANMRFCSEVLFAFFSAFAKLRKANISCVMSVRVSVPRSAACSHETARLPLDEFSWNLVYEDFSKVCHGNTSFIRIWREWWVWVLYMETSIYSWSYLAVLLRMRNVLDKSCGENGNTLISKNTSLMQLIRIYFTYSKSLHVSGRKLSIIRRIWYCTYQRLVLVLECESYVRKNEQS